MHATMMNYPLTTNHLIARAAKLFGEVEIVSQAPDRSLIRHTYADLHARSRALAHGLLTAGLQPGDRVATLMWNHHAHMEVYFGVPMAGGVYHTLNLRLSPEDLAHIVSDAGDRYLVIDDVLLPLLAKFGGRPPFERIFVVRWTDQLVPEGLHEYEGLIGAGAPADWTPPPANENDPIGMCYTSGTTGRPKGVVYSHRATVLHSLASALPDSLDLSVRDSLCPVVPMFHVNAWGLPFTATMVGAKQVHPGPHLQPDALLDLWAKERVNVSAGVPTIWMGIMKLVAQDPGKWQLQPNLRMVVGGSAAPESMIAAMDELGMQVIHAWGMTETTPLGSVARLQPKHAQLPAAEQLKIRAKQGIAPPFVEMRVVDDQGREVAWDGEKIGELQVRGPWVAAGYHGGVEAADKWTEDGWFRTGDVVTIDADGYMQITDRTKDLVKSGGEWISSVALENALMGHADVAEAAVVAVPHPKWTERPIAVVVAKPGKQLDEAALTAYLAERFEKWWLPDGYVVREEIPRGATGKFLKRQLRDELVSWFDDKPG
ncbi:long-chain fatty acid--CoA ligase [Enhygromyxa salina]|uniref:Long-chain-fatty-acid--CoA ligase n=1 Tax=Enhygromyxa salina TaxID=215803 RepID=A0A2S9YKF6_9BACT|nr:long-chain fatty acid--CoA ligase [Enhygromyxa salina]PRQ05591.1 Long-chain-fatty-acid--CoA ligase [Enhygromyxa salina]